MKTLFTSLVLTLTILIGCKVTSMAATTLATGDIAIIGLNSDGDDEFSFLLLKDITAGTSIYVTDKGWNDASGFYTILGDGIWQWSTSVALSAGTIVHIKTTNEGIVESGSLAASPGTVTWIENNGTVLSYSGDQIFLYQGTAANPTFITGCHWNVESSSTTGNWDGSCAATQTSALPNQLTNGVNAIWLYASGPTERDNFRYKASATRTGTPTVLREAINTISNWDVDDSNTTPYTLNPFPFSFTVNVPIVAPTLSTTSVTDITATSATGNGNITDLGSSNPTQHGVCWNTSGTPTVADSKTGEGAATAPGTFTSSMTGLTANTTYYVRSYATNSVGTAYGTATSFTTNTPEYSASTDSVAFVKAGGSSTVDINTDVSWSLVSNESWLTVSPESGNGNATLTLTAEANADLGRLAEITITLNGGSVKIIKVSQSGITTSLEEGLKERIVLRPNPANEFIQLVGIKHQATLEIADLNGKVVIKTEINGNEKIAIDRLSVGIYLVKVILAERTEMTLFIKE